MREIRALHQTTGSEEWKARGMGKIGGICITKSLTGERWFSKQKSEDKKAYKTKRRNQKKIENQEYEQETRIVAIYVHCRPKRNETKTKQDEIAQKKKKKINAIRCVCEKKRKKST